MTRTRRAAGVGALLMLLALAACGSDAEEPGATKGAGQVEGFPVTLTTKPGNVTIDAEPKRVVTLDFPSTDAVLALGVTPIAVAKVSYVPGDVQVWTKAALKGAAPAMLDADVDIPLEKIAALKPDLIVGANAYNLAPAYAKLSRIAPVVSYVRAAGADTWQESTVLIGQALGREQQARKLVADTEASIADTAAEHPNFKGRTLTLFNYAERQAYAISSPDDLSIRFLSSLGFKLPPAIERGERQDSGKLELDETRLQVSDEQLRILDADVVLGTSSDSAASLRAFARRPLFRRLPAVERGSFATLEIGPATSIAFPSVLSIDWALDNLVPVLDRLAK
jgi:iron complex transport system substrate-binding protein